MTFFSEEQKFRQKWLLSFIVALLSIGPAVLGFELYGALSNREPGDDLTEIIIAFTLNVGVGVGLLWLLLSSRLSTNVIVEGVAVQFRPLHRRARIFPFDAIASATARTYEPITEYGGWGIRGSKEDRAYNVSGNEGVQLVLHDGRRVLIGTRRPIELEAAIRLRLKAS